MLAAAQLLGCQEKVAEPAPPPKSTLTVASAAPEPTELSHEVVTPGSGDRAVKTGDAIKVLYVGKLLKNGVKFDENQNREAPFDFTVGEGVIEGWSKGVVGMKQGEKRKLTIPSDLAYGERGSPPKIPKNAALVFDIELIGWDGDAPAAAASASAAPASSAAPSAGSAAPQAKPAATAAPKAAP